jgi:hypothetical protein
MRTGASTPSESFAPSEPLDDCLARDQVRAVSTIRLYEMSDVCPVCLLRGRFGSSETVQTEINGAMSLRFPIA